jgi:hypothetical protein
MRFVLALIVALALATPALAFWHGVPSGGGSYVPTYYFLGF